MSEEKKRVLITGVNGLVGGAIYRHLAGQPERYEVWGLGRRKQPSVRVKGSDSVAVPEDRFVLSDLTRAEPLAEDFRGFDTIVHMAANPNGDADWPSLMRDNIDATQNVFEASRRAGVKRVIFASTIQVSSGYHAHAEPYRSIGRLEFEKVSEPFKKVRPEDPVWPINHYGASKVLGEALGRVYASSHGISVICLRIGWVPSLETKIGNWSRDVYCSQRDIARLTECCIRADDTVRFEIFYGMSNNRYLWVDLSNAREVVGYEPVDGLDAG